MAQAIESVYPQTRGGTPIDGVLAIDPYAIAAMLKITGPVTITGLPTPLTSANAADYLLRRQYLEFDPTDQNKARIDVLDDAGRRTFEAFLHTKSLRPAQLGHVFQPVVAQHRLLAMSSQPAEESFIRRIGLDGTFPAPPDRRLPLAGHPELGQQQDGHLPAPVHHLRRHLRPQDRRREGHRDRAAAQRRAVVGPARPT